MNLRGLVLDYLHNLQARGVQRLAVDDEARGVLREWMLAAKRGGGRPLPPVPVQVASEVPVAAGPAPVAAPAPEA
ncbi:MAG: hypothetical protein IKY91_00350, partial [Akkermansia sp.]|nr:hypothetical protein [Akkermansia sp.]